MGTISWTDSNRFQLFQRDSTAPTWTKKNKSKQFFWTHGWSLGGGSATAEFQKWRSKHVGVQEGLWQPATDPFPQEVDTQLKQWVQPVAISVVYNVLRVVLGHEWFTYRGIRVISSDQVRELPEEGH